MFEIRVICDETDAPEITKVLSAAFTTGPVRQNPTRDGQRTRLYLTADHHQYPVDDPYAGAPSLLRELTDVLELTLHVDQNDEPPYSLEREHKLRRAALLDRIALQETVTRSPDIAAGAVENAEVAAITLAMFDDANNHTATTGGPRDRVWAQSGYRDYVRQEYTAWLRTRHP